MVLEFFNYIRTASAMFVCPHVQCCMFSFPTSSQVNAQIKRIEAAGENAGVLKDMPLLTFSDKGLENYPLAEDFVKISVYARKLDVCLIEEELAFTWDKLFSEIGGAMGKHFLWFDFLKLGMNSLSNILLLPLLFSLLLSLFFLMF